MEQDHKDKVQEQVEDEAEDQAVALVLGQVANAVVQIAGIRRHID